MLSRDSAERNPKSSITRVLFCASGSASACARERKRENTSNVCRAIYLIYLSRDSRSRVMVRFPRKISRRTDEIFASLFLLVSPGITGKTPVRGRSPSLSLQQENSCISHQEHHYKRMILRLSARIAESVAPILHRRFFVNRLPRLTRSIHE